MSAQYDVVVIGGGAAGMMAAAVAGLRGRSVVVIEHYRVVGEKIRISGGGRCNFTNLGAAPANFLSANPEFCRSALARYTPHDFLDLLARHRVRWHEKKLGQLFCDDGSRRIIDVLRAECERGRVQWLQPCAVDGVARAGTGFEVATRQGSVSAASLVVATGGLSVPKIGATPFGYELAKQFGLRVITPRPALVPLAFPPELLAHFGDLSGVSVDAEVSCNGGRFRESLLFTHRGLSGPAILQISSYWDGRTPLVIDLLPGFDARTWLARERSHARLDNLLAARLPKRLAHAFCAAHDVARPLAELSAVQRDAIAGELKAWRVLPSGTLGWNKAEVTLGGVDTAGLSSQTMRAVDVPGLYFVGEAVDVTGWLGGYNFQWAWASGHAAGMAA